MPQKEFRVLTKRDQNGFWTARAIDPETNQEVENFAGANEQFALLGLEQALSARFAPESETTITIEIPEEGS